MKDDPPNATEVGPDPAPRPLALTPRPLAPGLEVRAFPGFAPEQAGATKVPLDVAGPGVAGEGGLLRAAGTFGCSALAGLVLTSFTLATTQTAGAPRSVRLERDARLHARAIELRDALREREVEERDGDGRDDL